jgi:ubiquitin-like 1-activating enzyme E1 B
MEDMWRFRDKPVALDFDLIQSDQFILRGQAASAVDVSDSVPRPANGGSSVDSRSNGSTSSSLPNGSGSTPTTKVSTVKSGHGLKDQRSLSLRENLALFISRWVSSHPSGVCCAHIAARKHGASRSAPQNGQRGNDLI